MMSSRQAPASRHGGRKPLPAVDDHGISRRRRMNARHRSSWSFSFLPGRAPVFGPSRCAGRYSAGRASAALKPTAAAAGQRQRHQHIVAGERDAEEAPCRLVAADDADVLERVHQIGGGAEIIDRAAAIGRAGPELPFDAGMIGRQARIPQHDQHDGDEAEHQHLARGAVGAAEDQQRGERHRDVESHALIEAERTGRIAEHVLEEEEAADGQKADRGDEGRGRGGAVCFRIEAHHAPPLSEGTRDIRDFTNSVQTSSLPMRLTFMRGADEGSRTRTKIIGRGPMRSW